MKRILLQVHIGSSGPFSSNGQQVIPCLKLFFPCLPAELDRPYTRRQKMRTLRIGKLFWFGASRTCSKRRACPATPPTKVSTAEDAMRVKRIVSTGGFLIGPVFKRKGRAAHGVGHGGRFGILSRPGLPPCRSWPGPRACYSRVSGRRMLRQPCLKRIPVSSRQIMELHANFAGRSWRLWVKRLVSRVPYWLARSRGSVVRAWK